MRTFFRLTTFLILIVAILSCVKDGDINTNPSFGQKVTVKLTTNDFGNKVVTTRAESISTDRERTIKNGKVLVFESSEAGIADDSKIIEIQDILQSDAGDISSSLTPCSQHVALVAIANVDDDVLGAIRSGVALGDDLVGKPIADFTYSEFKDITMKYTADIVANLALKNSADGLLPLYSDATELEKLDATSTVNLALKFAYARIDVSLDATNCSQTIISLGANNVPTTRGGNTHIYSHKTTPESNLSNATTDAKYIEGFYLNKYEYTDGNELFLLLNLENSEGESRFYKLLFRHSKTGENTYSYNVEEGTRYLINIKEINSPGYTTEEEAIAQPAANIKFEVLVDDYSTIILSSSTYYLGVRDTEHTIKYSIDGTFDNFMQPTGNYTINECEITNSAALNKDDGGSFYFDLIFSYNKANNANLDFDNLTKTITLSDGIIYHPTVPSGYNTKEDWDDEFGDKKIRFLLTSPKDEYTIKINIGELEQVITIKDISDESISYPVVDYSNVDFVNALVGMEGNGGRTTSSSTLRLSNSYILKPSKDIPVIYYIPVTERLKEVYENGYVGNNNNYIPTDEDWSNNDKFTVELLWSDGAKYIYPYPEKCYYNGKNLIKISVPINCGAQNSLICVRYGDIIIWSWHLWVTDYNPYWTGTEVPKGVASNSTNDYAVRVENGDGNGNLHHYNGHSVWKTGIYKSTLIMDRNIGATAATYEGHGGSNSGTGALYYQYGRKEPFPYNAAKDALGNKVTIEFEFSGSNALAAKNVVKKPTKMCRYFGITLTSYTNTYLPMVDKTIVWGDKNYLYTNNIKSIFDPSPLGFMVPQSTAFTALSNITTNVDTGMTTGTNIAAYYPRMGKLTNTSSLYVDIKKTDLKVYLEENGANIYCSTTTITNNDDFEYNNNYFKNNSAGSKAFLYSWSSGKNFNNPYGFPARCIQEIN